jgi:hypothetical protein
MIIRAIGKEKGNNNNNNLQFVKLAFYYNLLLISVLL